ncbi:MAG: DNA repair protein RecO [Candidatus Dadabacteria bacterium]|nr:MAG: DNA repair protein RecO [Candidatus Dadabacteria bacterium]
MGVVNPAAGGPVKKAPPVASITAVEEIRTRALVLRRRPFGESDWIVVLLTESAGKLSAIARGARRSRRRFAGPVLDPFQEVEARITRRPRSELAFLHECGLLKDRAALASDPRAYAWACYISELAERLTAESDPCPALYRELTAALDRLAPAEFAESSAHHFILRLLDHAGWRPDFERCQRCHAPAWAAAMPLLDPGGAGIVCARHEAEELGIDPHSPGFRPPRRVIDDRLLAYLRRVQESPTGQAPPETLELAGRLLDRLIEIHLGQSLKSRAFLDHVRAADR